MKVLRICGSPRNGNIEWMLAAALGPAVGAPVAPAVAFELSAELTGSAGSIATWHFAARLGESDLGGGFTIHLDGRPASTPASTSSGDS